MANQNPVLGEQKTSALEVGVVTLLRVAVGWHFLYEGVNKLLTENWTAAPYLQSSTGPFAGLFQGLAENPTALDIANHLNIWGLTLVGLGLILGALTRVSAVCGALMLALYYFSHPPFFAAVGGPSEGHYMIVDKNLVELLALLVIFARPTARILALDPLLVFFWNRLRTPKASVAPEPVNTPVPSTAERDPLGRRTVLASLTGVAFLGGFVLAVLKKHGWASHEEDQLTAKLKEGAIPEAGTAAVKPDAVTGATIKEFSFKTIKDLKGQVPHAKIKDLEISRMILGGNLIGGWAHARDLIYVSSLVKAYHHKWKVFETLALAEKCGINTFLTNPILCETINEYWKQKLGKIQFISDCGGDPKSLPDLIKKSIDNGAVACYVQGGTADRIVELKQVDLIGKALELIRKNGRVAGIGAHKLATVKACVDAGIKPDFWMKTFHEANYFSYTPQEKCDNVWCDNAKETMAYMSTREEPWIAFKTLAAGAIHPKNGFRFAFKGGADFICVGMYDFQMVDNVNLALDVLPESKQRERPWRA
jgi:uncharacterized membrane protein YphA (DoxX/SURF4 family)